MGNGTEQHSKKEWSGKNREAEGVSVVGKGNE